MDIFDNSANVPDGNIPWANENDKLDNNSSNEQPVKRKRHDIDSFGTLDDNTFTTSGERSKYDISATPYETLADARGREQSDWLKATNAIIGGAASGVLTFGEELGYLLDVEDHLNRFGDAEHVTSNWFSDLMKAGKEGLDNAMPIYNNKSDGSLWSDLTQWSNLKSIMDSAVGFGLTGGAAGAAVKGLAAASKYARFGMALKNALGANSALVQQLGAAGITNFAEGKMMALETYDTEMAKYKPLIDSGIMTYQEADKIAGEAADTMQLMNLSMIASDAMGLGALFKGTSKAGRNLLSKPGLANIAKSQLYQAPKEGIEEISQKVFQDESGTMSMLGAYDKMKTDLESGNVTGEEAETLAKKVKAFEDSFKVQETPELWKRVLSTISKNETLIEGIMGAIGGPLQYTITQAPFVNTEAQRKAYEEQQKGITDIEALTKQKFESVKNTIDIANATSKDSDNDMSDDTKQSVYDAQVKKEFSPVIAQAAKNGTLEEFEKDLDKYKDENPELYNSIKKAITSVEKVWNKSNGYVDANHIYELKVNEAYTKETLAAAKKQRDAYLADGATEEAADMDTHIKSLEDALAEQRKTIKKETSAKEQVKKYKDSIKSQEFVKNLEKLLVASTLEEVDKIVKETPALAKFAEQQKQRIKNKGKSETAKTKKDTKQSSKETINTQTIANKIFEKGVESLSKNEKIVYDNAKEEIDAIVKELTVKKEASKTEETKKTEQEIESKAKVDEEINTPVNNDTDTAEPGNGAPSQTGDENTAPQGNTQEVTLDSQAMAKAISRLGLELDDMDIDKVGNIIVDFINEIIAEGKAKDINEAFANFIKGIEAIGLDINQEQYKKIHDVFRQLGENTFGQELTHPDQLHDAFPEETGLNVEGEGISVDDANKYNYSQKDSYGVANDNNDRKTRTGDTKLAYRNSTPDETGADDRNVDLEFQDNLDPNTLPEGSEVEFRLPSDDYVIDGDGTTWGEVKETLLAEFKSGNLSDGYPNIPILVYQNGKLVGSMHTPQWITAKNEQGEYVNLDPDYDIPQQAENLKALRKRILTSLVYSDNIFTAIVEEVVATTYNKNNSKQPVTSALTQQQLKESEIIIREDGQVIITNPNDKVELPVFLQRTSLTDSAKQSIVEIVNYIATGEESEYIKSLKKAGVETTADMLSYLNHFVYLKNQDLANAEEFTTQFLEDTGLDMVIVKVPNGIAFKTRGKKLVQIVPNSTKAKVRAFTNALQTSNSVKSNVDRVSFETKKDIIVVGKEGKPETKNYHTMSLSESLETDLKPTMFGANNERFSFALQPIIRFNFDKQFSWEQEAAKQHSNESVNSSEEITDNEDPFADDNFDDENLQKIMEGYEELTDLPETPEEAAIINIAQKLAKRVGMKVIFIKDANVNWKGKVSKDTAIINLSKATADTHVHEIIAHPVIRYIKMHNQSLYEQLLGELSEGYGKRVFEMIVANYPELNTEEAIEEALVTLMGMHGAGYLSKIASAKTANVIQKLYNFIIDLLKELMPKQVEYLDNLNKNLTLRELTHLVLNDTTEIKVLQGDLHMGDNTSYSLDNEGNKFDFSFVEKNPYFIKGLSASRINIILDDMAASVMEELLDISEANGKTKLNKDGIAKVLLEKFKAVDAAIKETEAKLVIAEGNPNPSPQLLKNIESAKARIESLKAIITNRAKFENLLLLKLNNLGILKLNKQLSAEDLLTMDDESLFDSSNYERTNFSDNFSITLDSKNTASVHLKVFLLGIRRHKLDANGNAVPSNVKVFGIFENVIPFDEAYDKLHNTLVNMKRPSLAEAIRLLENDIKSGKNLWYADIVDRLKKAPESVQNEFVTDMYKRYTDLVKVMYSVQTLKNNMRKIVLKTVHANTTSAERNVMNEWIEHIARNEELVVEDPETGELKFNADFAKALNAKMKTLTPTEQAELLFETLQLGELSIFHKDEEGLSLGASDSPIIKLVTSFKQEYSKLKGETSANPLTLNNKTFTLHQTMKYLIDPMMKGGNVLDMLSSGVFRAVSTRMVDIYQPANTNSYRDGGKSVYAVANHKFLSERLNALQQYDKDLLDELGNDIFAQDSEYLQMFIEAANSKDKSKLPTLIRTLALEDVSLDPVINEAESGKQRPDFQNSPEATQELYKMAQFFRGTMSTNAKDGFDGKLKREAGLLYFTMSDKATANVFKVSVPHYKVFTDEGHVSDIVKEKIFKTIIVPEIRRMTTMNNDVVNIKNYKADLFYYFPELNELQVETRNLTTNEVQTISLIEALKQNGGDATPFLPQIYDTIENVVNQLVDSKVAYWNEVGLDEYIPQEYVDSVLGGQNDVKAAAGDMVVNYLIHNMNMAQLFTSDMANFYKSKPNKPAIEQVEDTLENFGKRMAGDNGSGNHAAVNKRTAKYHQIFVNDQSARSTSLEYYEKLFDNFTNKDDIINSFANIDSADAQEYTSAREHINVLLAFGKISKEVHKTISGKLDKYDEIETKLDKAEPGSAEHKSLVKQLESTYLSTKEINVILQPIKPVFVDNVNDELKVNEDRTVNHNYRLYIKSSSFPLIPQMTRGLDIDKLRRAIDGYEREINKDLTDGEFKGVRLAYSSAVKLGFPKNSIGIFENVDGELNVKEDLEFKVGDSNIKELDRKGFRIQQDVPYKADKYKIKRGTQESKLLFADILDFDVFTDPLTGEEGLTGNQIKDRYNEVYADLLDKNYKELIDSVIVDGQVDKKKFSDLLKAEAFARGYDPMSIEGIELGEDGDYKLPLIFNPSNKRFQALIASIAHNRIAEMKMPGKSYVLGSEEGFKIADESAINDFKDQIIFTDSFDGRLKHKQKTADGMTSSQVLLPQFLTTDSGRLLRPEEYTKRDENGKLVIDYDKVPKEAFKIFGFRIPTQSHSSMSSIEVVGILPEAAGDLIIASRDFVVEMGSDFDVDKLYTYRYLLSENKETAIAAKTLDKLKKDIKRNIAALVKKDIDESIDKGDFTAKENAKEEFLISMLAGTRNHKGESRDMDAAETIVYKNGFEVAISTLANSYIREYLAGNTAQIPSNILDIIDKDMSKVSIDVLAQGLANITKRTVEYSIGDTTTETVEEVEPTTVEPSSYSNFDATDNAEIKIGSLVTYKGEKYIVRNINASDKVQLTTLDGVNFSGTPARTALKNYNPTTQGTYKIISSSFLGHDSNFIVLEDGRIMSLATGKFAYDADIPSNVTPRQDLLDQVGMTAKEEVSTNSNKLDNLATAEPTTDQEKFSIDMDNNYNKLQSYRLSIADNADDGIQSKFSTPLEFGKLKTRNGGVAKEVADLKKGNTERPPYKVLSDDYNRMKYNNAAAGKIGIGIFSLDSVFNALAQGTDLSMNEFEVTERGMQPVPMNIKFGEDYDVSNGSLSRTYTLRLDSNEKRPISKAIEAFQSASVDNEKEAILEKININNATFGVASVMLQLGFDEELVAYFLNQPIILDFVKEFYNLKAGFKGDLKFNNDADIMSYAITKVIERNIDAYEDSTGKSFDNMYNEDTHKDLTGKSTLSFLRGNIGQSQDGEGLLYQIGMLIKFRELSNAFDTYRAIRQFANVDSKGLGSDFESANRLQDRYIKIKDSKAYNNMEAFLKSSPFLDNMLSKIFTMYNVFKGEFGPVYSQLSGKMLQELRDVYSVDDAERYRKDVEESLVQYIIMEAAGESISDTTRASNVNRLLKFKTHPALRNNAFVQSLYKKTISAVRNGNPTTANIIASVSPSGLEQNSHYMAFLELLDMNIDLKDGYSTTDLAIDLLRHSLATGGANNMQGFFKNLPAQFVAQLAKKVDMNAINTHQVINQMFRNKPYLAPEYNPRDFINPYYVTKRDAKGNIKLYTAVNKSDGTVEMTEINRLGNKLFKEYGSTVELGLSVKGDNTSTVTGELFRPLEEKVPSISPRVNSSPELSADKMLLDFIDSMEQLDADTEGLAFEDPVDRGNLELIKLLLKNNKELLSKIKAEISSELPSAGRFKSVLSSANINGEEFSIFRNLTLIVNKDVFAGGDISFKLETVAHELVHAMSIMGSTVGRNVNFGDLHKENLTRLAEASKEMGNIRSIALNEYVRRQINENKLDILGVHFVYLFGLTKTSVHKDMFDMLTPENRLVVQTEMAKVINTASDEKGFGFKATTDNILELAFENNFKNLVTGMGINMLLYSMSNNKELMATIMTNDLVKKYYNSIQVQDRSGTIVTALKELFNNLLKMLGIKKGTLAEEAFYRAMDVINIQADMVSTSPHIIYDENLNSGETEEADLISDELTIDLGGSVSDFLKGADKTTRSAFRTLIEDGIINTTCKR